MAMTSFTTKRTFSNGKMPCIPFSAAFSLSLLFSAIRHSHDRTSLPTLPTRRTLGSKSLSTTRTKQTSSQRLLSWQISLRVTSIVSVTTRYSGRAVEYTQSQTLYCFFVFQRHRTFQMAVLHSICISICRCPSRQSFAGCRLYVFNANRRI